MMIRGFRKTRTYERYYPQGFGIVAAASVFWLEICFPLQNGLLLSASVTFGAILFGFTGTAFAVFNISMDFMEKVRRANQEVIFDLRRYIRDALLAPMLLCVISVIACLAPIMDRMSCMRREGRKPVAAQRTQNLPDGSWPYGWGHQCFAWPRCADCPGFCW